MLVLVYVETKRMVSTMVKEQNLVEIHKQLNGLKQSSDEIVRMLRSSKLKSEVVSIDEIVDSLNSVVEQVEAKVAQLDGKVFTLTSLGSRLRESRLKDGVTQRQLAEAVGVTPVSIQKIEDGVTKKPRNLQAIADFLNVDMEWLAAGDESGYLDVSAMRADGKLGERLRKQRVSAGYTLRGFAGKLDCTDMSLSKIENGITSRPRNLTEIAKLLDVSPAWLLGGVEPKMSFEEWEHTFKH